MRIKIQATVLNPFIRTAVPIWGQTTWNLSDLSPKRKCGSKRVKACFLERGAILHPSRWGAHSAVLIEVSHASSEHGPLLDPWHRITLGDHRQHTPWDEFQARFPRKHALRGTHNEMAVLGRLHLDASLVVLSTPSLFSRSPVLKIVRGGVLYFACYTAVSITNTIHPKTLTCLLYALYTTTVPGAR